ncbi:chlorophyll a/b-binding protein domain-containing protein, partial [Pavlovales sp. CCMP2436]
MADSAVVRVAMTDTAVAATATAASAVKPAAVKPGPAVYKPTRDLTPPSTSYGNGKRPRAEWDKDANYNRYATMKQAMWSTQLPAKVRLPFMDTDVAIPTFARPKLLDGTHAGDSGFDPLGLARDVPTLQTMLEAELKHGRLAMLAVLGWAMAELLAESGLAPGGRAPSLLNGGLFSVQNFLSTGVIFALVASTESSRDATTGAALREKGPGMYDWQHFLDGGAGDAHFRRFLQAVLGRDRRSSRRALPAV